MSAQNWFGPTAQDIKRQVCQHWQEDDLQPDEVILRADGMVVIDRRGLKPWAKPGVAGYWSLTEAEPGSEPGRGPARQAVPAGWGTSGPWARLAADTAGFEAEDDGELMAWMAAESAGMAGYGEALEIVFETVTGAVGVDPAALAALHDCAEDAADAAAAMETARAKFAAHYEEPREFAASGGVLPHDGRWVTGEGD